MPLGGPSLASLLSPETERALQQAIPDDADHATARANILGNVARCTRWLYNYGTRFAATGGQDTNRTAGENLWFDAEEFFDKLDRAARQPQGPAAARLVQIVVGSRWGINLSIVEMRNAAKRLLAYECSRFLGEQHTSDEPWLPYVKWKRQLSAESQQSETGHAVLTFNYDCVLEALGLQNAVVMSDPIPRKGPHIFKLHGSCNWRHVSPGYGDSNDHTPAVTVENDEVEIAHRPDFTATCDPTELAIAAPGPGKQYQTARFQALWDMAGETLKAAGAVVILGYRMPPTDARSRRFLLENLPKGQYPIHVVLGHDTNSPDARRMYGLLKMARPQASVEVLPLFAQDYIDAFDPTRW